MNIIDYIKLETGENILKFKIVPNSKKTQFCGEYDDGYKLKISQVPENNKANKEIISYLSKNLKIDKKNISIISGEHNPVKIVKVIKN